MSDAGPQSYVCRTAIATTLGASGDEAPFLTRLAHTPINATLAQAKPQLGLVAAVSPNSRLVAVASNPDFAVRLYSYNGASQKLSSHAVLTGHTATVQDVVFGRPSEHPNLLVSAAEDGFVVCWDVRSNEPAYQLFPSAHGGPMFSCDVSGNLVAAGGEKGLYLWDVRSGREVAHSDMHTDVVRCVRFHPSEGSRTLFSGGEDGLINVFDLARGGDLSAKTVRVDFDEALDNTLPVGVSPARVPLPTLPLEAYCHV